MSHRTSQAIFWVAVFAVACLVAAGMHWLGF